MEQDITTILGIMDIIITITILMVIILGMIIGTVGVLDFHLDHPIIGGDIIIGVQDGRIGGLIITDLLITIGTIITIRIDHLIIEEVEYQGMKNQRHITQIEDPNQFRDQHLALI